MACAWKPKVSGLNPAGSSAQSSARCSNQPANVQVSVKRVEAVESVYEIPPPSSVLRIVNIRERRLQKKIQRRYSPYAELFWIACFIETRSLIPFAKGASAKNFCHAQRISAVGSAGGLGESVKKEKYKTKIFFRMLNEVLKSFKK